MGLCPPSTGRNVSERGPGPSKAWGLGQGRLGHRGPSRHPRDLQTCSPTVTHTHTLTGIQWDVLASALHYTCSGCPSVSPPHVHTPVRALSDTTCGLLPEVASLPHPRRALFLADSHPRQPPPPTPGARLQLPSRHGPPSHAASLVPGDTPRLLPQACCLGTHMGVRPWPKRQL